MPTSGSRIHTTSAFEKRYNQLNKEQKHAVDTIEGPVMVVAGPGTGKTETVGLRVANILRKTQAKPGNILCLTFSNPGAKAMRERLRSIIGPDAYAVAVSTVHSFCNDLIQQRPQLFVEFRALEQVSQIERLRIIRRAFAEFGPEAILPRPVGDGDRAADVLSRITDLKKEGMRPKDLWPLVDQYAEEITKTPTGKPRDLESKSYLNDLRKVDQFKEFIQLYEAYEVALKESHRYDFDDMILVVLDALKEHDWMLAELQERFQYVLVDEFQDLNGAQNRVIETITTYLHTDQPPNLFVVGDDDQAIFRFQGASIGNMHGFLKCLPDTQIITLTTSYRCPQPVLDLAMNVIDQNKQRLAELVDGIDKQLVSGAAKSSQIPRLLRYPDTATQYAAIAAKLQEAHQQDIEWKDMAVICRRNEEVLEIAEVLSVAGIPSEVVAKQDLTQHPQVLEAIVLLKAVAEPETNATLAAALAISCFGCAPEHLGRLWVHYREAQRGKEAAESLHAYLLCVEDVPEAVLKAHLLITDLHQRRASLTLPELLETLLYESALLPDSSSAEADPRAIAGLHAFYEYVKSRCYEQKSLTLEQLLEDLDQFLKERSLRLEYEMPHLVHNGVQLLTAHGAKGLEFDLVVIANLWYGNWGNRKPMTALALPDHLVFGTDQETEKDASQEDERRLFYVATTRAKSELSLYFPETYRSGEQMRDAQVSSFIAEAGDALAEEAVPTDNVPKPIETISTPELQITHAFKAFLEERLESFSLSVTALNSFLRDPQQFLWEQLLAQPRAKAAHLAYGTAVHAALQKRGEAWHEGRPYSTEDLIAAFEQYMDRRELFVKKDREHFLHVGRGVLERYAAETQTPALVLFSERPLQAHLDDIPLKGKVDRIDLFEPQGRQCRIIDFKTGSPLKTEAAVRKDENYFRQLVFYKLLCDLDPKFAHEATVFTFDFVGNDTEARRVIDVQISQDEVRELSELIRKVWDKIIRLDFTPLED